MPHEKGRLTGTLTRHNRPLESYLAGLGFSEGIIGSTLVWGNRLQMDAERWLSRGGFAERGRIGKADAARMLRFELKRLEAAI